MSLHGESRNPWVTWWAQSFGKQSGTGSPFGLKRPMWKRERMEVLKYKGVGAGGRPALGSGEQKLENPIWKFREVSFELRGKGPPFGLASVGVSSHRPRN